MAPKSLPPERMTMEIQNISQDLSTLRGMVAELEARLNAIQPPIQTITETAPGAEQRLALITTAQDVSTIVKRTGLPMGTIAEMIAAGKLANAGTEARPRYLWVIGDAADPDTLRDRVEYLLTLQPQTLPDLIALTGARRSRVSGAIVQIQRRGTKILNLGSANKARWFIVPRAKR